jgi:ammonia channel protein AmtB
MTSPSSTAVGLVKWLGLLSSLSAVKRSLYVCMGALLGLVCVGAASVAGAGRPPA